MTSKRELLDRLVRAEERISELEARVSLAEEKQRNMRNTLLAAWPGEYYRVLASLEGISDGD